MWHKFLSLLLTATRTGEPKAELGDCSRSLTASRTAQVKVIPDSSTFRFDCYPNSQLCNVEFSSYATEKNYQILFSAFLTQFRVYQILSLFLVLLNSKAVFEQPKVSTILLLCQFFQSKLLECVQLMV